GPTTSIREEPYQADVMKCFGLRGMIGKGGMGDKTLKGCQDNKGVYFHAVGGAAVVAAQCVTEVIGVEKLDFGSPEAFWIIRVEDFHCVVTMDSHGGSLHKEMMEKSRQKLNEILSL
ncbi:MAG: fumarate hydratase C-terminal domain-containing protein, partial [Spirochaetota bacterium]|nr:fumarate hydratase C-terminal domain-containing protein [Spirochaetota bacterium]